MRHSGSIYFTDSHFFLSTFSIEGNAGIYTQQGNDDTDDCEKQDSIFQHIFHSLYFIQVVLKCTNLIRYILRKYFTTDFLNPLYDFFLLFRVTFYIAMANIFRRIIEHKSIAATMIMDISLERSTNSTYGIIIILVIKIHSNYILLLFVLPYFIHDKVIFCPDSSALLYRNIHKSKEIQRNAHNIDISPGVVIPFLGHQQVSGYSLCISNICQ